MREINERLRDIHEAIVRIEKYAQQRRVLFDQDELVQTWIIHHLEIIGEAPHALPQEYQNAHPGTNWKQISGMRNILIHMYFGIDQDAVWAIVERDLPRLKSSIEAMLLKDK